MERAQSKYHDQEKIALEKLRDEHAKRTAELSVKIELVSRERDEIAKKL